MSETRATSKTPSRAVETPIMRSPLARSHTELGVRTALEAGWELPSSYGDLEKERVLLREHLAIADVTPRGKIDVRGRAAAVQPGDGELSAGISGEWTLLLRPPGPVTARVEELEAAVGTGTMVTDATHLLAGFVLAGPRLDDLLARVSGWDPSTLGPGSATGAPIAEVRTILLRRELGAPMVEAFVPTELARYAWEAVLGTVLDLGGGPVGWEALRAEGWS